MYVHYFVTYEPQYIAPPQYILRSRLHREVQGAEKSGGALQKSQDVPLFVCKTSLEKPTPNL